MTVIDEPLALGLGCSTLLASSRFSNLNTLAPLAGFPLQISEESAIRHVSSDTTAITQMRTEIVETRIGRSPSDRSNSGVTSQIQPAILPVKHEIRKQIGDK